MDQFIKKYLSYLLTGSFSVVFAACYGPPMDLENPKHINAKDNNNQAIPGLKVTVFENRKQINELYTNESGEAEFYLAQKDKYVYRAVIEDVDGIENLGEFQSTEVNLTEESLFELKLEKKN